MLKHKDPNKTPAETTTNKPVFQEVVIDGVTYKKVNMDDPEQVKAYLRDQDEYGDRYIDDLPVKTADLDPDIFNHGYSGSFYMLCAAICSRVDVGEVFVATQRMMADAARMSLYTARVYIPTLTKDGWIERVRKYDGWYPAAYRRLK